jgi:hypothetical protein
MTRTQTNLDQPGPRLPRAIHVPDRAVKSASPRSQPLTPVDRCPDEGMSQARELAQRRASPPDRPFGAACRGPPDRIWAGVSPSQRIGARAGARHPHVERAHGSTADDADDTDIGRFADVTALRRAQRQHSPAPDGRRSAASTASGPRRRLRPPSSRWSSDQGCPPLSTATSDGRRRSPTAIPGRDRTA